MTPPKMLEDALVSAGRRLGHDLSRAVIVGFILLSGTGLVVSLATNDRDNTDGDTRSGMTLHTDAATGCEYLSTKGGMTPRLTASGQQRGCR